MSRVVPRVFSGVLRSFFAGLLRRLCAVRPGSGRMPRLRALMPTLMPALMPALMLIAAFGLAGCESSEERAERHYRSGLELLETGEVSQALIEFRNVFDLNPRHREARETYARVQRARGETGDAYGQYLRLVEQYPDMGAARLALAEMAVEGGNWDEAELHGRAALKLAPQDAGALLVNAALDYRAAVLAKDTAAAAPQVVIARERLVTDPGNLIALRMVIDHQVQTGALSAALPEVEAALAARPELYEIHGLRLRILAETGDIEAVGAALKTMAERFPENQEVARLLIAWYIERKDMAGAEAFLRQMADAPGAGPEARMTVVEFLRQTQDEAAALAELDRLIASEPAPAMFRAMRATINFEAGRTAEAIAAMQAVVAETAPAAEQTAAPAAVPADAAANAPAGTPTADQALGFRIVLSRMLLTTGDVPGARALIDAVLAQDPGQVEALKMRAAWLIDEDKPGDAILALRSALAQAPRDATVLDLMGQAHERDGARELAGERYALAVEVSGRAVPQSLRYAAFLTADDRLDAAAGVLTEALALAPQDIGLLQALANLQIAQRDWDRAAQTVAAIRALNTPQATAAANGLDAELLMRQDRVGDTVTFLEGLAEGEQGATAVLAALVQTHVENGQIGTARTLVAERLEQTPDDPGLRFLRAGLDLLSGDAAAAEATYGELIAQFPGNERAVRALYGLMVTQGRVSEAGAVLETALAANPAPALRLMRAEHLERVQDFDGAIAAYQALYAENSANLIVANNLANLLGAHRSDPADLERAHAIARRLRGQDVPAFQDTYGWIAYRRGAFDEALAALEPAARGLPDDPLVQFHLGMTYLALKRPAEARDTLTRALDLAGDSPLPQFKEARSVLEGLAAAGAAAGTTVPDAAPGAAVPDAAPGAAVPDAAPGAAVPDADPGAASSAAPDTPSATDAKPAAAPVAP